MLEFSVVLEILNIVLETFIILFFLLLVGYVFLGVYLQMKKRKCQKKFLIIVGLFLITTCTTSYFYIEKENEWKDTIHQSLEENHYLLPEKVNGKFEPIIKIQDRLKKKALLLLLISI